MKSLFTTSHFNFLKMTKKQKDVLFTDISYLGIVLFCSPLTRQLDKQFFYGSILICLHQKLVGIFNLFTCFCK